MITTCPKCGGLKAYPQARCTCEFTWEERARVPHRCPICEGAGVLSRPPGVPVGQDFTSTSSGPWPCGACGGTGVLWS